MASNRGFWLVTLPMLGFCVVLVILVFVFRPLARSGAVAYAQSNLRTAAEAAKVVAKADGSLSDATALGMRGAPGVDDLLLIDPDTASNDPEIVSVYAQPDRWTGAARADTGECYWIRVEAGGRTVTGTGTDCSAEEAAVARADGWPEP
jgi:ABC-type taurine transport system substrate-binding protein